MNGLLVIVAGTTAAVTTLYLWGRAVLALLHAEREGLDVTGSVLAGLLALVLAMVATVAVGGRPSALAVGMAIVVTIALAARRRGRAAMPDARFAIARARDAMRERGGRIALALTIATAVVLLATFEYARHARIAWDGVALWTFKAHALGAGASFRDHYLAMRTDPRSSLHLDYPLAVPSLTWWLTRHGAGTVPVAAGVAGALWLAALPAIAATGLRRAAGAAPAALAGLAIVVHPILRANAYGGMADLPLGACILATVVELLRDDDAGRRRAALFAALAASTKSEGLVLAIALPLATMVASLVSRSRSRLTWALVPFVCVLPWQLLLRSRGVAMRGAEVGAAHATGIADVARIALVERAPVLLRGVAEMMFTPTFLPPLLLFLSGALVVARHASRERVDVLVPWMVVILHVIGLGTSYLMLVDEPIGWLVDTSLLRLLTAILPTLAVLGVHGLLSPSPATSRGAVAARAPAGRAAADVVTQP
jgi:hypothetical protein